MRHVCGHHPKDKFHMKKLFLILFLFTLTFCSSDVNVFEYVDENSSLKISILDSNSNLLNRRETEIQINSDKYSRLLKWADKNIDGWHWDPVSHIPADIIVSQGSFRLLYWVGKDNAVIAFTDRDNKSKQYSKSIKKGSLDFLSN
jgi:hypothetical protein